MKLVKTVDAVGQVLCHDLTQIIPSEFKGPRFRKGHIIQAEDIPVLLSMGKDSLYIWENDETVFHEDEAATILADLICGQNLSCTPVKEGKIELISDTDGLLILDRKKLNKVNSLKDVMIASLPGGFEVKKGERVAGTRVIPLVIKKERIEKVRKIISEDKLINVYTLKPKKYAVLTTGNEVFHGRIEDKFTPVLNKKLSEYGCSIVYHQVTDDNSENIENAIRSILLMPDVEMLFCTGGMSVDPDDRTPLAIRRSGVSVVSYGAPVLPGAMFLMGYAGQRPVCGLPGCVMYTKRSILDILIPYMLSDIKITSSLIYSYGNGGLCRNCEVCHFPNCSFGKGN